MVTLLILVAVVSFMVGWFAAAYRCKWLRYGIKDLWNENLAETIDRLTSDEVMAEAMAKMDDGQLQRLADRIYEKRGK